MSHDALDGWLAEGLRLSFFGVSGWSQRAIFKEISGVEPAATTAQRMMQVYQEAGDVSHAHLTIVQQANRIDVVLGDRPTQNTVDPSLPGYKPFFSIGPFRQSLESFDSFAGKAVALLPNAIRVAYAITLIRPTSGSKEAIRAIHKLIPRIPVDPENDTDLLFQINRPTRDDRGLLINRLAKWEALQVTTVRVNPMGGPIPIMPATPPVSAAQIYIDANTDAGNIVPLNNLSELLSELRQHAVKLAEAGEA
ncbi:hypothetical protein [Bradyrhizobium sp. DASA03120]|uniref:hypothetical protein n=1 Tax=Bradyrhizobium sp. SMVTL-02 TaxID=3395917 RepID=UPI003F71D7BE